MNHTLQVGRESQPIARDFLRVRIQIRKEVSEIEHPKQGILLLKLITVLPL